MTPRAGHFWPQGHNLNNFGRGPLGDDTYQISRLVLVVTDKKIFSCFPYISLCKTCDPQDEPIFRPHGHYLNKLGRGPLDAASYQI